MKPIKLKPEDALFYLKDALCEHCEKECDTCDCIQLCKYGTAYKMAKEALTTKVAYICKGSGADYPCQHTTDITKAKNFKEVQPGSWIEVMHEVDNSEIVPDYRDGWRLKEGDQK